MQELVKNIPPHKDGFSPSTALSAQFQFQAKMLAFCAAHRQQRGSLIVIVAICDRCPNCTMYIICTYSIHM